MTDPFEESYHIDFSIIPIPEESDNELVICPNMVKEILGISDIKVKIEDPENICAICSDNIKLGEIKSVYPYCEHYFHTECLDPWIKEKVMSANCPNCRDCPLIHDFQEHQKELEYSRLDILEKIKKVRGYSSLSEDDLKENSSSKNICL